MTTTNPPAERIPASVVPDPQEQVWEKRARVKKRRRRVRLFVGRTLRRVIPIAIILGIVAGSWASRDFLALLLAGLSGVFRIVFAIIFVLVQFIAIFWFLSKTKTETILPGDPKSLTFEDYKGQPRLVELVRQWLILLSDREKFTSMGGNFINGLMMYGAPGTGKTMLAKCMAGEGGLAFMSIEGAGFRGMFLGMDVLRMMQFTNKAKKLARQYGGCIAFIDEIDAVGASRGGVMQGGGGIGATGSATVDRAMMGGLMGGGNGALTRLLVAMDGVDEPTRWEKLRNRILTLFGRPIPRRDWHVLYVGSTNRPDVLDPALTRPGRFDIVIQVDPPDKTGRREIISYYLSKIEHDDTIDIEAIVEDTNGYTPAQIMAAITKGAVRIAIFDGRSKVSQRDIDLAFREQTGGLENPIEEMPEDQRRQIAYHEAGHAVAVYHFTPKRRITRATIIRSGTGLGHVATVYREQQFSRPLSDIVAEIKVSMAGQIATKVCLGEMWTGASGGDYPNVRFHLWRLASEGYFGPPITDPGQTIVAGRYEGELFDRTWDRIEKFWHQTEQAVESFFHEHHIEVEAVAQALIERESLMGDEVSEIIESAITNQAVAAD